MANVKTVLLDDSLLEAFQLKHLQNFHNSIISFINTFRFEFN